MVDLKFRSALLNKDTTICYDIISSQLKGENLVSVIYELLHASALVKYEEDIIICPILLSFVYQLIMTLILVSLFLVS